VHEYGVRAAFSYFGDGPFDIFDAGQGADGDAVVHGYNDDLFSGAVEEAFQSNGFTDVHGDTPDVAAAGARRQKKAAGDTPAALVWFTCF
jgi:hypothetical protein